MRRIPACGLWGAWVTVLFLPTGQTVLGFSNNGWETDYVYACQKRTDGGATKVFTETGTFVRNLTTNGTNWWSLTFAAWTKLQGPAAAQVDNTGRVHGWTPGAGDWGSPVTFQIEARNSAGADSESWLVIAFCKADFDQDNDVDQDDFAHLQKCLSGVGQLYGAGCGSANLDPDDDVDLDDFGVFQSCMNGANALPGC